MRVGINYIAPGLGCFDYRITGEAVDAERSPVAEVQIPNDNCVLALGPGRLVLFPHWQQVIFERTAHYPLIATDLTERHCHNVLFEQFHQLISSV